MSESWSDGCWFCDDRNVLGVRASTPWERLLHVGNCKKACLNWPMAIRPESTFLLAMFTTSATIWFVLGVVIVLITPGPTNTLLAAAGLRQGMRRAARLAGAEVAGYGVAISAWGGFLAHAVHTLAWLPSLVRMASCLYVAYLALRMWRTTLAIEARSPVTIGPYTLFVATLLNPKAILFAGTIFPSTAFVHVADYVMAMSIFLSLVLPIGLAWIAFGAALGRGRLVWISAEGMQRCASVVLAAFSLTLAWSLFQ